MQNFSMNSKMVHEGKEYQIRTSNNGRLNKVICSLFRDGDFINSKEIEYKNISAKNELLAVIDQLEMHRNKGYHPVIMLDDNRLPHGGKPRLAKVELRKRGWTCLLDYQQTLWIKL